MKATGIVRKIDDLGRIVIPIEVRRNLDLKSRPKNGVDDGDSLEIYVEDDSVVLKKYQPSCVFCGEVDDTVNFKNKIICRTCLEEAKKK